MINFKKPDNDNRSGLSFFNTCMHNVGVLLRNSVGSGSAITYSAGWSQWEIFTPLFGTNLTLSTYPREWFDNRLPYSFVETAIAAYMAFLQSHGKKPSTISTYTYGVIYNLRCLHVDLTPLNDSKLINKIKSSITHMYQQADTDVNMDSNIKTMPINMTMLMDIKNRVLSENSRFHNCLSRAILAAFVYLFRPTEFIVVKDANMFHYLREQDVMFTVKNEMAQEIIFPSSEAYRYASRYWDDKWKVLIDVMTSVRHAKNDPNGVGNRYVHEIEQRHEQRAFCIASVMFECAIICKPNRDDPFFSCSEEAWRISEKNVGDAIKASSRYFLNDPAMIAKFTPRSLRVGGASALMLSGSSDSFIQKAGRWKSNTFLDYLRVCVSLTQERTAKMCQASSGFSNEAIKKQLPMPVGLVKNWN